MPAIYIIFMQIPVLYVFFSRVFSLGDIVKAMCAGVLSVLSMLLY